MESIKEAEENSMKKQNLLSIFIMLLFFNISYSYGFDNENTHPEICKKAIANTNIDNYLISKLYFKNGILTPINGITILKYIQEGSILEDIPNCRAANHFHNPLQSWDMSGIKDLPWVIEKWCQFCSD
jgi:hypothetical protein